MCQYVYVSILFNKFLSNSQIVVKICGTVDLLFEVIVFIILIPNLNNVNMAVLRTAALMTPAPHCFSGTSVVFVWRETECSDAGDY